MIRLLLQPVNLLILDEPTNHLDMSSKDVLKQAIKDFDGTVIVVSHDREFLDGLVDKVYEFGGGEVRECLGGIYEFLEKKRLASLSELERSIPQPAKDTAPKALQKATPRTDDEKPAPTPQCLSYAEQREQAKLVKRAERRVADLEAEIAAIEAEIADVENSISQGVNDRDIYDRHAALNKKLDNTMSLWELASEEYTALAARANK